MARVSQASRNDSLNYRLSRVLINTEITYEFLRSLVLVIAACAAAEVAEGDTK